MAQNVGGTHLKNVRQKLWVKVIASFLFFIRKMHRSFLFRQSPAFVNWVSVALFNPLANIVSKEEAEVEEEEVVVVEKQKHVQHEMW